VPRDEIVFHAPTSELKGTGARHQECSGQPSSLRFYRFVPAPVPVRAEKGLRDVLQNTM
jgi:hypothetical protein